MTNVFRLFTLLADVVAYRWLGLDPATRTAAAVHFFVEDVTKIFALLVTVIFVMGLFRSMLSPERVRAYLEGRSRWAAYVMAVVLGAVTPFCSCSSVPLFIGFVEAGIPVGATMAFLITSPMVNEVAVVLLLSLLGWKLTVLYVVTGLVVGVVGGALIDTLRLERWVEEYVWKIKVGAVDIPPGRPTVATRVRFAWGEVRDIVGRIWAYVLVGVGLGAGLHGYVPQDFFARYAGASNPFAVPLAVVAGVPMYSNASGIIPVAEALLGKGVPVGTVLALMMSVVALSLPEMIILRKVLTVRMLGFFAAYLAVSFIAVGYLFNTIQPVTEGVMKDVKDIKVLGSGCRSCQLTAEMLQREADALGVEVQVEKVTDVADIMGYGVMRTPGVVLDGKVVHAGGVPHVQTVRGWLGEG